MFVLTRVYCIVIFGISYYISIDQLRMASLEKSPLKICVTGAGGQIAYSLLYLISDGKMFGKDQPVVLTLLEIPIVLEAVQGVVLELQDCALPLLKSATPTADPRVRKQP